MKVLLLTDVAKLGKRHSVIEVADGYALNVLIPKKQARRADKEALSLVAQREHNESKKEIMIKAKFATIDEKLGSKPLVLHAPKHKNGHLFAALPKKLILEALHTNTEVSFEENNISLEQPIKTLGTHAFTIEEKGYTYRGTISLIA